MHLPDLKLSADGLYYWDGAAMGEHAVERRQVALEWLCLGARGRHGHARVLCAAACRRPRATGWTKPLQYSVVAWYLLYAIWSVAAPLLMAGSISDYVNQAMQQQVALNPGVPPPPADVTATINSVITVALGVGAAIGVAISAVAIIGALGRWRWVFYAVLVLLGLQAVSFPITLVSAFSTSSFSPIKFPVAVTAASVAFGIPAIALFIWMAVAAFQRGPWAMKRVPPS